MTCAWRKLLIPRRGRGLAGGRAEERGAPRDPAVPRGAFVLGTAVAAYARTASARRVSSIVACRRPSMSWTGSRNPTRVGAVPRGVATIRSSP